MADSKMEKQYDIIIVGAGPSGSTCAAYCAKQGKKVLLIDRAKFPRDKICGDATSGRSIQIMQEIGAYELMQKAEKLEMHGVTFSSPKGDVVKITKPMKGKDDLPGYICKREILDNVLFQTAKKYCDIMEEFFVNDIIMENGSIVGVLGTQMKTNKEFSFRAKIIVGADGSSSIVAKKIGSTNTDTNHQVSAIRAYYDNVDGMDNRIELHFVPELIPGYFWIFPLPNKSANVGVGMIVKDMKEKRTNLQKAMLNVIQNNPMFKERFKNAKSDGKVKSWFLPLGSKRVKTYGNGCLLLGDAASLIDPFTGEGVGNGMISGKVAAEVIKMAFEKNDFSEDTLKIYQKMLFDELGPSLDNSYKLQRLGRNTWLLNWIINKAKTNQKVRDAISSAMIDPEKQKEFSSPFFYLKMLFA